MMRMSMLSRGRAPQLVVVFVIATQLALGQQWNCRYPQGHPLYPQAWDGLKKSSYSAYIPGDNVIGGTPCSYYIGGFPYPFSKHYKADGNPVQDYYGVAPARVMHFQFFKHVEHHGIVRAASETRAYGAFSPANGSTLSAADEDGIPYDCYLFHDSGYGDLSDFHEELTFPYSTQAQVRLYGTGANPLEPPAAKIRWDVRVVTDYNHPVSDYVTAYANVTHTCYPAHVVQSQNAVLYHYTPPQNDPNYIFACLVLQTGMISGHVTPTRQVPCQ